MTHIHEMDRKDSGFTLVELAIVMIIIGLLIGGILKGQELITNAQVAATVSQLKGVDAAVSTFRDSYNALPGDMPNPQNRLPNCGAGTFCQAAVGTPGNGRLDTTPIVAAAANEALQFWAHLNAADLITGVDGTNNPLIGEGLPPAPIGGTLVMGFHPNGALGTNGTARGGHYISLRGAPALAAGSEALQSSQAARIDRKMDDGSPASGIVFVNANANCVAGGEYDEPTNAQGCDIFVRIQG